MNLLSIMISAILVNNFVLVRFLGICPFIGVSKKISTAFGMGAAVTFVMAIASPLTALANQFILIPFDISYLQTVVFILIIACLVQFVEMFLQKMSPALYNALGIYLPLITTNCAVLGVTLLSVQNGYNILETTVFGICSGIGFTLAVVLFAGIRERLMAAPVPKCMRGTPVALVCASFLAIAFLGFQGLL